MLIGMTQKAVKWLSTKTEPYNWAGCLFVSVQNRDGWRLLSLGSRDDDGIRWIENAVNAKQKGRSRNESSGQRMTTVACATSIRGKLNNPSLSVPFALCPSSLSLSLSLSPSVSAHLIETHFNPYSMKNALDHVSFLLVRGHVVMLHNPHLVSSPTRTSPWRPHSAVHVISSLLDGKRGRLLSRSTDPDASVWWDQHVTASSSGLIRMKSNEPGTTQFARGR